MPIDQEWDAELEELLDALSYEISNARAFGLAKPEELREALKRMRNKVAQAANLAAAANAERQKSELG
jgi:hypothetical protein